jgi:two-component system, NarL family, sensor kinase
MEWSAQRPRPRAAAALALAGLIPCVVVFALAPHDRLLDPLTLVLAACALAANLLEVEFARPLRVSASFVCCVMAAVLLGPAAAFAVAFVSEVGVWALDRFDPVALASNCFATVAPTLLAAAFVEATGPLTNAGILFDVAVALGAAVALATNAVISVYLMALCRGRPAAASLVAPRSLAPLLALNVSLTVLVAEGYRRIGLEASLFVLVVILAFSYAVRLWLAEANESKRVEELSNGRGLLIAQALKAEDRERRNLAERLHDGAVQNLLAARQEIEDAELGNQDSLSRAQTAIEQTVEQLRDAVFDLHPSVLEHAGLAAALSTLAEKQARRSRFTVSLTIDPAAAGVADEVVFSLCREFLANAAQHARATSVSLNVERGPAELVIYVRDDGVGFDEAESQSAVREGHIGLASSTHRVEALGGQLELTTTPGTGTSIRVTIPVADALASHSSSPRRMASATAAARSDTSSLP